ncbi:MAG: polysaccharide deacetylase family protein [Vicinamibacterales bacterium]
METTPRPAGLPRGFFAPVPLAADERPRLFIIVDTEEEFDWSAPFSREAVGVTAIDAVDGLHRTVGPYGLRPTYVIDYPVAATPSSARRLKTLADAGDCEIGAHLHPWVNPPYDEPLGPRTSYACNLGADLEAEKLTRLAGAIAENLGLTPRVYKAGRYGFGTTTAATLERIGFDVDVSVNPHMDFTGDGGPDFRAFDERPGYFGGARRLLEVPCTTGFIGAVRRAGPALHPVASAAWLRPVRAVGILSRSGLLNRVMLSPEGSTLAEMQALTRALHADGARIFCLTFHSPSLKPGCTPYVRTASDLDAFLATIDRYCDFFIHGLGGVPGTPAGWYDQLTRGDAT